MDLTILLIGTASVAGFIVPIFFLQRANKREELNKQKSLKKLAEQNGVAISKFDLWNDNGIGVDLSKNKVFYANMHNEKPVLTVINLSDFVLCRVINDSRTVKTKHNKTTIIERISLVFKPVIATSTETAIVFFDKNININLGNELLLAEKWEKHLNELMRK